MIKSSFRLELIQKDPLCAFFRHSMTGNEDHTEVFCLCIIPQHFSQIFIQPLEINLSNAIGVEILVKYQAIIRPIVVCTDEFSRFENCCLVVKDLGDVWIWLPDGGILHSLPDIIKQFLHQQDGELAFWNKHLGFILSLVGVLFHHYRSCFLIKLLE